MKQNKIGFTITELLVVVVVIGILSAVVLPKFTKTLENYKTAEAEHMLEAVRDEQEARCTLGDPYTTDSSELGTWATDTSKHFNYTLQSGGMTATRTNGEYSLSIPSYFDGRICCEGCENLNKDYVSCSDLMARTDYRVSNECSLTPPECIQPAKPADVPCGCNNSGLKKYTWNASACTWELGSACVGENTAPCSCVKPEKPNTPCGCNNTGTLEYTWDQNACKWVPGECIGEDAAACQPTRTCYGKKVKSLKLWQYDFIGGAQHWTWKEWKQSSGTPITVTGSNFLAWGGAAGEPRIGVAPCENNLFGGYQFADENCYTDNWELDLDTSAQFVCGASQGNDIPGLERQPGAGENVYWPEDGSNSITCQQCVIVHNNSSPPYDNYYESRVRLTCEYAQDQSIQWKCPQDQQCGISYGTCKH